MMNKNVHCCFADFLLVLDRKRLSMLVGWCYLNGLSFWTPKKIRIMISVDLAERK